MGYFLAMTAAMGLQQLKIWEDNKQKEELADKQRAFKKALQDRQFEQAKLNLEEANRIALDMEHEAHQLRRKDIEDEYDNAFDALADQLHLEKWPLSVVPFIMKGESFGSRVRGFDVASINCVVTPSNNDYFNKIIYPKMDMLIERVMNLNWNSNTDHSVIYYGAAWKQRTAMGVPKFDNNDVERLYAGLRTVPFICITPYFKGTTGEFVIKVRVWGLGEDAECNSSVINPSHASFPKLSLDTDFDNNPEIIIENLSLYIVSLIGYLTDMYYWKMYNTTPLLPLIANQHRTLSMDILMEDYCNSAFHENARLSDILKYGLSLIQNVNDTEKKDIRDSIIIAIRKYIGLDNNEIATMSDLITEGNLMMWLNETEKNLLKQYLDIDYSIKVKKINYLNKNLKMNAEQYSHNKEVLLDILSDILKIEMLPKSHRAEFEHISKKISADQFSIALIGEFQGGKSTTFDALCDGREISPRGNNIKTSACRIRVTNIDVNTEEHAIITWKSDTELIQTISSVLTTVPPEELGYDSSSKEVFSYSEYVNLSNPKHRAIIEESISTVDTNTLDRDTRDVIMIAKFILANYDKVKDLREEKTYSFKEAIQYMVFPQDMLERYNDSGEKVTCFNLEESLFAFVQTVDCYIHSESLKRLGCSFVDCPGLFASEYDTSIAIQTMCASDATLYLLGGEKQMGQADIRSIGEIMKIGKAGNKEYTGEDVFFAINQRKPDDQTSFVRLNLSEINQAGFKKDSLPLYNAFLYYYAQLGLSFLEGKLDENTLKNFMSAAKKGQDFSQRWVRIVNRAITNLDLDEEYEITDLSHESVALVKKLSKADKLFSDIENYIVGKKSYSILIDNGAIKVQNGLSTIESALREKERSAQMDVAEKAREFQKAREAYKTFRNDVETTISTAFPSKDNRIYLEDSYRDYFLDESVITDVAFKTTVSLIDYMKKGGTKWRGFKLLIGGKFSDKKKKEYEAQFASDIKGFLTEAFSSSITPVITRWITTLYAGKDFRFDNTVRERALKLGETIQENWKQLSKTVPLFNELSLPNIEDQIPQCVNSDVQFSDDNISGGIIEKTSEMALKDAMMEIVAQIVSYVTAIVVMFIVDMFVTFGLALIIGIISEILVYVGLRNPKEIKTVSDFKKKELALYNELKDKIRAALSAVETREQVCFNKDKGMVTVVNSIVEGYKSFYLNELDGKKQELEDAIKEQEELYNGTRENLEKIASDAKRVRETEIQPLLSKVSSLIEAVTNEQ